MKPSIFSNKSEVVQQALRQVLDIVDEKNNQLKEESLQLGLSEEAFEEGVSSG